MKKYLKIAGITVVILGVVILCLHFVILKDYCIFGDGFYLDENGLSKPFGYKDCGLKVWLHDFRSL